MIEHKSFPAEVKEASEQELTVTHFISTETPDRTGDIVLADGMRINGRPVVLFQHGHGPMGTEPIARPVWIRVAEMEGKRGILAKTEFYPDETGRRLWDKAAHGWMPNWSIGFRALKTRELGRDSRLIEEWELLEYSPVAVPMNPDARVIEEPAVTESRDVGGLIVKMLPMPAEDAARVPAGAKISDVLQGEQLGQIAEWRMLVLPEFKQCVEGEAAADEKPYPSEHACRLEEPDKYERFRRSNDKFGRGIHAIFGIMTEGGQEKVELQAIRFDRTLYSADEARAWLKEHDYKCRMFEPASDKEAEVQAEKGAIPYKKTPLAPEDEPWDAAAEVAKATVDDLRAMCVWYDADAPDNKTSYKGPHHKAGGEHACVWNGVRALAAVIMGARGGLKVPAEDMDKIKAHVAAHYRDFDKGPPPWEKSAGDVDGAVLSWAELNAKIDYLEVQLQTLVEKLAGGMPDPQAGAAKDERVDENNSPAADADRQDTDRAKQVPRLVFVRETRDRLDGVRELAREAVRERIKQELRRMLGRVD